MAKIVIAGGGWAGCAAAIRCVKAGHKVVLLEKTDLLIGLGNVGGIMRNNGRYTAAEENICMGAGELFEITDRLAIHRNINFPGHEHGWFYDVILVEPEVRRLLIKLGVEIKFMCRAVDIVLEDDSHSDEILCESIGKKRRKIVAVEAICIKDGEYSKIRIDGDVFIETTGSAGPMGNCARYGRGCGMCILRCPAFGPRVSLTEKGGVPDYSGERDNGLPGAFSGSCKLEKRSLDKELQKKLDTYGFAVVPIDKSLVNKEKLSQKVCQQYALSEFAENIVLIDTGYAKLMSPFFELEKLRTVEGFENARFADPYAAGKSNSLRYMSVGHCDLTMRADGYENLFLGGEKAGLFVGHTEAITTGSLAGYNATLMAKKIKSESAQSFPAEKLLRLPEEAAVGRIIKMQQKSLESESGMRKRFTFAGGEFFEDMKKYGLYSTDLEKIESHMEELGLTNIYNAI